MKQLGKGHVVFRSPSEAEAGTVPHSADSAARSALWQAVLIGERSPLRSSRHLQLSYFLSLTLFGSDLFAQYDIKTFSFIRHLI